MKYSVEHATTATSPAGLGSSAAEDASPVRRTPQDWESWQDLWVRNQCVTGHKSDLITSYCKLVCGLVRVFAC